jgi:hypothetical protein
MMAHNMWIACYVCEGMQSRFNSFDEESALIPKHVALDTDLPTSAVSLDKS